MGHQPGTSPASSRLGDLFGARRRAQGYLPGGWPTQQCGPLSGEFFYIHWEQMSREVRRQKLCCLTLSTLLISYTNHHWSVQGSSRLVNMLGPRTRIFSCHANISLGHFHESFNNTVERVNLAVAIRQPAQVSRSGLRDAFTCVALQR